MNVRAKKTRLGRAAPALALAFLAGAFGELLSGSSPPLEFFNPLALFSIVGFYGSGAILVRELALRWGGRSRARRWAIVLILGAAYGIIEEGLATKSFFDPFFADAGPLAVFGRWLGVNWLWAIDLTLFHMVISIAAPILVTELLFPARRDDRWVGARATVSLVAVFAGLVAAIYFLLAPYRPPAPQYVAAALVVVALGLLARRLPRRRQPATMPATPRRILAASFGAALVIWLLLMWVAYAIGAPALVPILLTVGTAAAAAVWLWRAAGAPGWTDEHSLALASGPILFWALLAVVVDEPTGEIGMSVVGAAAAGALIWLRRRVRDRLRAPG